MEKSNKKSKRVSVKKTPAPAQSTNAEEMALQKGANNSDYLFIGWQGALIQWSISKKKEIKYYGDIMHDDEITALKTTADKKHLFVADYSGE